MIKIELSEKLSRDDAGIEGKHVLIQRSESQTVKVSKDARFIATQHHPAVCAS